MSDSPNPMNLSDAEWKQRLGPEAYAVLRKAAMNQQRRISDVARAVVAAEGTPE